MKKGYLKVLAVVAAVAMLMSMSLSVFADAPTYTTSTNYVVDDSGAVDTTKVKVVTNVTGLGTDEQVAYLVKNGENIIWIDQKAAEDGEASFDFITAAANALGDGSLITVGSTNTAATGFAVDAEKEVKLASYTVTFNEVVKDNDGNVIGKVEADATSTTDYVTFTVYPAAGYAFDKCVIKGTDDALEWIGNSKKILVEADTEYEFSFKAVEAADLGIASTAGSATVKAVEGVNVAEIAGNATGAAEFGILVINAASEKAVAVLEDIEAADLSGWDNTTDKNGVRKYQAGATNESGDYLISLTDTNGYFFAEGASYKAVLYALNGTSLVTSNVFDLAVPAAE